MAQDNQDGEALADVIAHLDAGERLVMGSGLFARMSDAGADAGRICAAINTGWHTPAELRELLSELTGTTVDGSVRLTPPFNADFGRNIHFGKDVFLNSGCKFQDQGGIFVGDGAQIGHNVVIATLNHPLDPARRHDILPQPVRIGRNVWIGSNATVLPGVTIGDDAAVGAGAVVTKDVAPRTVVAGVPARFIKAIEGGTEGMAGA
ncbi:sugar O-acetyltransferase [Bifidobacterium cuniculi]|uniref:sugar O-acetyltransferase n=1 Tax=Bifidobacterium cuniculi TaxID=1688 RepID=UPI000529E8AC|nr:sugar O-acetyltransferase [Bifidobacterium cuniculi]